ncbi:amidase [Rothia terrae]|uniref:Amidase n=1 Tax=Rothia terrae TaxID=396015 RepID=A0A7H2BBX7_9MICC|nr:amidase [Rothia terrae]QNV37173.1 amidase [Rothia terrae]
MPPSSWAGTGLNEPAQEIAEGERSSLSLVQECLQRIKDFDVSRRFNAIIDINKDALVQAGAIDERLAQGKQIGPLAGVPFIVKANIGTSELPNSSGNLSLAKMQPTYDSDAVRVLREAGAIVLATANTSEYAWHGTFTHFTVGGTTGNFFDSLLSASGSSGGSAVAVAAGYAPFALGTDTCGSITGPAAHASLVGFRPTHGSVSTDGVIPLSAAQDAVGVIASTAHDTCTVARLLNPALGNQDIKTTGLTGTFLTWPFETVGAPRTQHRQDKAEVRQLVERAATLLFENIQAGHQELPELTRIDFAHHFSGSDFTGITHGIDGYLHNTSFRAPDQNTIPTCVQTLKKSTLSDETVANWRSHDAEYDASTIDANKRKTADNKHRFSEYLAENQVDFLVFATSAETASKNWAGTAAADISANTGSPSVQIPVGFTTAGLPVGITIVTRPEYDTLALWLGEMMERALI